MSNTLTAKARISGKACVEGDIPAVVYGPGRETMSVAVTLRDFQKVWKEAGESGTVTLATPEGNVTVLIHEIAHDPVRGTPQHIDFLAIDVTKPIQVNIPIEFTGTSAAVKNGAGVLVKVIHEIEVKGLATDIPHQITVDVTGLAELESAIKVADLVLPKGVIAILDPEENVALISSIKEETEEPAGAIDFTQIEVEKKGKKEEDGETAA